MTKYSKPSPQGNRSRAADILHSVFRVIGNGLIDWFRGEPAHMQDIFAAAADLIAEALTEFETDIIRRERGHD
jgi:hypothetical protein